MDHHLFRLAYVREVLKMKSDNLQAAIRARLNNQAIADKRHKRKQSKQQQRITHTSTRKVKVSISKARPASIDFLESYQWRKLRMEVLKKYGAICQCCGASRKTGAVINVDHIKPRKLFPHLALNINNLQVLCAACNHGKGNWDMTDWR
jgi:5-methylcytosine-specific restriction endonuclease McrA